METVGNRGGNTIPLDKKEKKRQVPSKRWAFTAYDEKEDLEIKLESSNLKWIMGTEICPTTNREHGQGYLESEEKIRPKEMFKTETTHWEHASSDKETNIKYCMKDGKYKTNFKFKKPLKDPMEGLTWMWWQNDIKKIINEPVDSRKIYWFWEETGGVGKSTFCKHLCMKYGAMMVGGKGNDIKYAVSTFLEENDLDVLIYDVPRVVEHISYASIEEIKNGCMFNNKYESGMKIFNSPHIIIFANREPEIQKLSADRWEVVHIG